MDLINLGTNSGASIDNNSASPGGINTHCEAGNAGRMLIDASGTVLLGTIDSSSADGDGGDITLIGGAVEIQGDVDSSHPNGEYGSVILNGSEGSVTVQGTVTASGGQVSGSVGMGSSVGDIVVEGTDGSGWSISNRTEGVGRDIGLDAAGVISLAGGIDNRHGDYMQEDGVKIGTVVTPNSVTVGGGIDSSSSGDAGGVIEIYANTFIHIQGDLISAGYDGGAVTVDAGTDLVIAGSLNLFGANEGGSAFLMADERITIGTSTSTSSNWSLWTLASRVSCSAIY